MKFELNKRFKKNLEGRFGKYELKVGILEDDNYRLPKRGKRGLGGQDVISKYAGGSVRKKSNKDSGLKISEVSAKLREHLGLNFYLEPFKKKSEDIIKFSTEFFKYAFGKSEQKRLENLLQAIVRNPFLRHDYGQNSPLTKKIKGFDRLGIDTGQVFKSIKAEAKKKGI